MVPLQWKFGTKVRGLDYGKFTLALINHTECSASVIQLYLRSCIGVGGVKQVHIRK